MTAIIRRFVDWMERSPAYKTVYFVPLLMVIFLIAWGRNRINDLKGYLHTK